MRIISYDGVVFSDIGVTVRVAVGSGLPGEDRTTNFQPRHGASPLMIGAIDSGRPIPVLFTADGDRDEAMKQARMRKLLSRINVRSDDARALVAEIDVDDNDDGLIDGTTTVTVDAICGPWMWWDAGVGIELTFYATDAIWTETTDTTVTIPAMDASANTETVTNAGATTVSPTIRVHTRTISPAVARDRRRVTITNGAELPLEREAIVQRVPYSVGMTGGAALLKDGTFHPVTRHYPSVADYQWFAFPVTVDPGESETYDLIGQVNTAGTLDSYTRFDGNYAAPDITFKSHQATSGTTTQITVSGANWPVNRWAGASVRMYAGPVNGQHRIVLSNTPDTLTVTRPYGASVSSASRFTLIGSGWYADGGFVSSAGTTTLTDSSQSWVPSSLIGLSLVIGAATYTVTANTATQLTFTPAASSAPTVGTGYIVEGPNYHRYYVDQIKHSESHRGGWQINKRFTQPSKVLWGADILNAWEPFLLKENGDDYNQIRWAEILLGGSDKDYFPILYASRRRGQDRRLQEEGQADGVAVYDPLGYQAMRFDYAFKNPNGASGATKGITKFITAGREPGGDEFETYVEDDTLRATEAVVAAQNLDLSAYGNPTQLYMGLQPQNGTEISRDALESDTAEVRWNSVLRLWLNIRNRLAVSVSAIDTVTPVEDEIRIGDLALQIGQRDGQRLYIKQTDELYFDCANARAWIDPNPRPQWVANSSSATTLNSGATSVSLPTGTQAGDTIIAMVTNSNGAVLTPDPDMTLVETIAGTSGRIHSVYVGTSDGSSQSWSYGSAPSSATIVLATYRGVSALVDHDMISDVNQTTHTVGPVSATTNGSILVYILWFYGGPHSATYSFPVTTRGTTVGSRTIRDATVNAGSHTLTVTSDTAQSYVMTALTFSPDRSLPVTDITYAVTPWDYATNRIADRWPVLKPGANTLTVTTDTWTLGGGFSIDVVWREAHFG